MKGHPECPVCKGSGFYDIDISVKQARGRGAQRARCYWKPVVVTEPAPVIEVVKVQLPIVTLVHSKHQALIYDQKREKTERRGLSRDEQRIINGRLKVFCNAIYTKSGGWRLVDDQTSQNKDW